MDHLLCYLNSVYSMQQCNDWKDNCDFSPAFGTSTNSSSFVSAFRKTTKVKDSCFGFSDCADCLGAGDTCGWCDGTIVDTSGSVVCGDDGLGCCGGDDGFSFCNVTYRKTCPVVCDWTDWESPTCRTATTPEFQSDDVQKAENCGVYFCFSFSPFTMSPSHLDSFALLFDV